MRSLHIHRDTDNKNGDNDSDSGIVIEIQIKNSDVKRRNTLGCLDQNTTPNNKYTEGGCPHPNK